MGVLGLESIAIARHAGRMAASAARVWDVDRLILDQSPDGRKLQPETFMLLNICSTRPSRTRVLGLCFLMPKQPRVGSSFEQFFSRQNPLFPWQILKTVAKKPDGVAGNRNKGFAGRRLQRVKAVDSRAKI